MIAGAFLAGWAAWVVLNLLIMLLGALVLKPKQPFFDGFKVRLPAGLALVLSQQEIAAIIAHEHGHRHYMHTWSNLALRCVFLTASLDRRRRQELEADDYAAARGHGRSLADALRKMSDHPDDLARADRLERRTE